MTTAIIDYKASAKKGYEYYTIDREVYPTIEDLKEVAEDCLNDDVYLIKVFENAKCLFVIRNEK